MASKKKSTKRGPERTLKILAGPELWALEFTRGEDSLTSSPEEKAGFTFEIGFSRLSRLQLGVELGIIVDDLPGLKARVSYRTVFELGPAELNEAEINTEFQHIGARIAPFVMYPFIRETLVGVTQKAGLGNLVPPIVNFASVFVVDEMVIPTINIETDAPKQ